MLRGQFVPISTLRWRARTPRVALIACCTVLSLAGLRTVLAGSRPVSAATAQPKAVDGALDGFAEGFARAYVSVSSSDSAARERDLKAYGFVETPSVPANAGGIRVRWSAVVASQARAGGGRIVTVLLDDGRRDWYLAVPVVIDRSGRRLVPSPPALVGAPSVRADSVAPPELEVDDAGLRQVVERVLRHYLAGDRVDLAADLARGAVLTLPPTRTRLVDVDSTTWAARLARVAAAVTAAGPGSVRLDLRYELSVVRFGGRWLVRGIQVNPLDREQQR